MKTITELHIRANRWFQKTYGNTYHRVRISIIYNDGTSDSLDSGKHYGYGEGWNQTALMIATQAGLVTQEYYPERLYSDGTKAPPSEKFVYLTQYAREKGITTHTSVSDVSRQRDL
jgi:hypothetical protein